MPTIEDIKFNPKEEQYEIKENGILYRFPFVVLVSLKHYAVGVLRIVHVADWYKTLNPEDKKKVTVIGKEEAKEDNWYPDFEFD